MRTTPAPSDHGVSPTLLDEVHAAFLQTERVAFGKLSQVLAVVKRTLDAKDSAQVLFFRDRDGTQRDFDLRGNLEEVLARVAPATRNGPGRPKLGVMGREVSLLPRHWEWLEAQPNGISAAIRRLVDLELKRAPETANALRARDATGRFLTAMAGNLPGYEDATRALYRGERARFQQLARPWPKDVRKHSLHLAKTWFESRESER